MSDHDHARPGWKAKLLTSTGLQPVVQFRTPGISSHYSLRVKLEGEPLKAGQRGLIVSTAMEVDPHANRVEVRSGTPDEEELRAGLLFWDRIEWPTNNMFHQRHPEDFEFLISEGVLTRSRAELSGSAEMGKAIVDATRQTYAALDDRDLGRWTVSRHDNSYTIIGNPEAKDRGLNLRLYRAIPVPAGEVPFEEILRFREKRRPELLALRESIDEAYIEILKEPDRLFAESAAIDRIDRAVADLLTSSKENHFRQFLADADFNFDWKVAGIAVLAAVQAGLPIAHTVAGAAAAGIGLSSSLGSLRKRDVPVRSPFEYVAAIHRDLPWTG